MEYRGFLNARRGIRGAFSKRRMQSISILVTPKRALHLSKRHLCIVLTDKPARGALRVSMPSSKNGYID